MVQFSFAAKHIYTGSLHSGELWSTKMNRQIFLLFLLGCLSVTSQAQASLSQITLFSPIGHNHDTTRTAVNFETGERGFSPNQPAGRFDMSFGTLMINSDNNWFEVRDSRSRIADLGKKQWADFRETPSFPKAKETRQPSLNPPKVVDASAGSTNYSPYNQFVQARLDHMYLLRVLKAGKVVYVMFRVEQLESNSTCLISFKAVPPPKADIEN